jgi:hypothetical protein
MIEIYDQYGDYAFSIYDIEKYYVAYKTRSVYETEHGRDWNVNKEGEDPYVSIFHITHKVGNRMTFAVKRQDEFYVRRMLDSIPDYHKLDVERPSFTVYMTEEEFLKTVKSVTLEDWVDNESLDFGAEVNPLFFVKTGLYKDEAEVQKGMDECFPNGGKWLMSIKTNILGISPHCEVWPCDGYKGTKECFHFVLEGTCTNVIKRHIEQVKKEKEWE